MAVSKKQITLKKRSKKVSKKTNKKSVKKKVRRTPKKPRALDLRKFIHNPVITPASGSYWESEAVFNPGAVRHGGRVHLFYRALGPDGISRIGYASSQDGVHFDKRFPHPVYMPETVAESAKHYPYTSPSRLSYNTGLYISGGGWGGCEDPRAVKIDGRVYLTFNVFNGWHSIRVGLTPISEDDLEQGRWNWRRFVFLSPPNERHKNWALFSEKIGGKYALFHNLHDDNPARVRVEYLDNLEEPILLFDSLDPGLYKLGALLLNSKDPRKILYRSRYPVLEPDKWYENDWKPGTIYASGAVVKGGTLFIYYGGGDKHIGVASTNLEEFVKKLMNNEHAVFSIKSARVA